MHRVVGALVYPEETGLQLTLEELKCWLRPNDGGRSFQAVGEA